MEDGETSTVRIDVSLASWRSDEAMAEVLVRKGKLWGTMGIMRSSKLCCHVEEAAYMVEQGSLQLLLEDKVIPLHEVYDLLVVPSHGCSWEAYQIFCHLKRLGYIVGRHNVLWTNSSKRVLKGSEEVVEAVDTNPTSETSTLALDGLHVDGCSDCLSNGECGQDSINAENQAIQDSMKLGLQLDAEGRSEGKDGRQCQARSRDAEMNSNKDLCCSDSTESVGIPGLNYSPKLSCLFTNLKLLDDVCPLESHTGDLNVMFDVHLPNSRFKKTDPGMPAFTLCIVNGSQPPKQRQVRELELKIGSTPLKFGFVDCGHVSIFSFSSCVLPTLL